MPLIPTGLRSFMLIAAAHCAVYPLALAGQMSMEYGFGDALLIRELQYGSARTVANELLRTWLWTLPWVATIWVGLTLVRPRLREAYLPVVGGACVVLVGVATAGVLWLPSLLAWLLAATVALEAFVRLVRERWPGTVQARAKSCA
jgi:hypothetical protein